MERLQLAIVHDDLASEPLHFVLDMATRGVIQNIQHLRDAFDVVVKLCLSRRYETVQV